MQALERFLAWGGVKKDMVLLAVSAISLILSMLVPTALPFDAAWIAIILCGIPILLEAIIGLVTVFDIKADVLVSIALIASVLIGEDFAAGEIAFIMPAGGSDRSQSTGRNRAACAVDAADSPGASGLIRKACAGRIGSGGRPFAGTARRDHSGGWRYRHRADRREPGCDDRRILTRG